MLKEFVVHIHASRKIWFKVLKSMDPEMLAIILFHDFFRERFFKKTKSFFYLLFTKIFIILAKLKQGQDKTARNKEAFSHNIHFEFLKTKKCLLWKLCKFYYLKRFWALPYLQHELEDFYQQIWKVSCRGLSKKICIQSLR